MQLGFEDKIVLITGASGGIGRAVAEGFAAAGAEVALHYHSDRDSAEELRDRIGSMGGRAEVFGNDLSARGEGAKLISAVESRFGRIDILINNAGSVIERSPIAEVSDELYDTIMHVNLRSVFEVCRAAIPGMEQRGSGTIVNVSSIAARTGGAAGSVPYASAKAAVAAMTRGLGRELASTGIRVNAVSPGFIDTPFHGGKTDPATVAALVESIPQGRVGAPQDCVGPVLFLASDAASGFVTSQVVEVNGGQLSP